MSEVRLIDADALMETIREDKIEESVMQIMDALGNKWEAETVNLTCERHIKMIDDAPTIDPVVRCKDCRWWDKREESNYGYCHAAKHGYYSRNWEISIYRTYCEDFFCADGERKGE